MLNIPILLDRHCYRQPSFLVDAITEHDAGRRLVAVKNVTVNEEYFQGHFPGAPVMPGVMMLESLSQVAAMLLLHRHATVTICHSATANLSAITRQADVLIAAIGCAEFVTAEMVKPGAVVIEVGIKRLPEPSKKNGYRLAGDGNFAAVAPLCAAITPVPGGVGPMTVAMLLKNTVKAFRQQVAQ